MLLIKLLRFIQGYIDFQVSEGFPERFINLCTKDNIPLWNIKNNGKFLFASTTCYALNDVKRTAEKSGMKIDVLKETSLKSSLKKHKKRKGLLISLFICFLVTVFLSGFIWSISVEGNEEYTTEQILEAYEENGVKIGALKSKIDTLGASENAVIKLDNISWAKVNIRGCFAVIEVRESIKKPKLLNESTPVNIVSDADGQIIKYEVEKGESVLKPGIAVTKGDLLVSGVLTNKDSSERLVHSKAKITAKTTHLTKSAVPENLFSKSEEDIRYSLFFFGLKVPSYSLDGDYFESRKYLENNKKILPVGVFRYRQAKYNTEYEINDSEESLLSAFDSNLKAIEIYRNSERVLSEKISFSNMVFKCKYICEEEIGVEKEILTG